MIKVLFFARDPGGANCIIPVIRMMDEHSETKLLAKDKAYERFESRGFFVEDINTKCNPQSIESIKEFISKEDYDAVVTGTSVDDYTERFLWEACTVLGIPCVAIVDQWTNLGIRFSQYDYLHEEEYKKNHVFMYLPTIICVMDRLAEQMITREGVPQSLIRVTGQPHFDTVKQEYEKAECSKEEGKLITFVSEPIFRDYDNYGEKNYWGFNEFSVFSELVLSLREASGNCDYGVSIIVRPHPRDDLDAWEKKIKEVQGVKVRIDSQSNTFELLKKSDLICGMSSMMLLEAAICNIPIMSVMIGLKRENPFVLNNVRICPSILLREDLNTEIKKFLEGEFCSRDCFDIIDNATSRVVKCINEVIMNGKAGN